MHARMHVRTYVAGSQKCFKDLANTRLDLRNAANSLQIEGRGCYLGTHPMGGGNTGHGTIHMYVCVCVCISDMGQKLCSPLVNG